MKHLYAALLALALLLTLTTTMNAQITCQPNGNLFVYANYDGGVLDIDVDVNIPNIKIGICTYEPVTINITGAFVNNVTEVRYAGYVSTNNNHCPNSPATTTINGVNPGITSVNFLPAATLSNPNGYNSIVCAYSCSTTSNQGGCNTADQIKDYFQTSTGGILTSYYTQYGCWANQPYLLSAGGNCCSTVLPCNITANAGPNVQICPGASTTLNGSGTGGVVTYAWSPTTGLGNPNSASTTAAPTVTTTYVLTVSDTGICADQDTVVVTVLQPVATLPQFPGLCANAAPYTLTGGTPAGGTYTGTGVSNGVFNPQAAGVGTHTITYTAVDGNGCTATTTGNITVHALPVVTLGQMGPFCTYDPATVLTAGSPAGGDYTGPGVLVSGTFDPSIAGVGSHNIVYSYTDANGCNASASTAITVHAQPNAPVLSYNPPNLVSSANGDSIQWLLNGQYLLTNGSSIVPAQNGMYSAIVWVDGCASDTSGIILVELVGTADGPGDIEFTAWPNPAGDVLYVDVRGTTGVMELYDAMGRRIREPMPIIGTGHLRMEGLGKGIYYLRLQTEEGIGAMRVVKE
jgi:hypothetical protein